MSATQRDVLKALSTVQDPGKKRDIVSLDTIKDLRIDYPASHRLKFL